MDARPGKIAFMVAVVTGGLIWVGAPGCSSSGTADSCTLHCAPKEFCCSHATILDTRLPDGGPQPIPDGGHEPGETLPACLHGVSVGYEVDQALPNGQRAACDTPL